MPEHRLLRASAGTGKTWQLTEAYASLVTNKNMRPAEVVAITFTRKAAAELKLRIRTRLRQAAVAETIFTELAHAPVTNFHGLALQLLRQAGSRAGTAPATGVLGDGDDARLFTRACEAAWFSGADGAEPHDTGRDTAAVKAALQVVSRYLDVAQILPAALWQAFGRAREDGRAPNAALLGMYDAHQAQADAQAQLAAVAESLAGGLGAQTGKSRDKLEAFLRAASQVPQHERAAWSSAWSAAFQHLDRRGNLGKLFTSEQKAQSEAALASVEAEALCATLANPLGYLLEQAQKAYDAHKQAARVMDFGDIITRVVEALQNDAELHADVTRNIRAVLVDEAQDTNPIQREMIRLLAGLTGPAARPDGPAQLIVVGDRKQCIYTFRGADPRSFDLFANDIAAMGGLQTQLSISRRSRPQLVAGINHLGEHLFDADAYEPLEPLPGGEAESDGMHWVPTPQGQGANSDPTDPTDHDGPRDPADSADPAMLEARTVAALIGEALAQGQSPADFAILLATMTQAPLLAQALSRAGIPAVIGGGGGLLAQPEVQDILALLAWLCDPGARLEAAVALRSPLIGLSDGALSQLLQRATDLQPAQQTHATEARRGDPLSALSSGRLPTVDPLGVTPEDVAALQHLAAWLPRARDAARTMSAADCLQFCDAHLHLRAVAHSGPRGAQKQANVERLFDVAARFDQTYAPSVQDFVRLQQTRLAQNQDEPVTPPKQGARAAVRVCSVHQSKGLQFKNVILPFLNRRGRNDTHPIRYHRESGLVFAPRSPDTGVLHHTARWRQGAEAQKQAEDAELRRLLYVAVTRAEDRVFFVGPTEAKGAPAGFAKHLYPWRTKAIEAGHLREAPASPHTSAQAPQPLSSQAKGATRATAAPPECTPLQLMRTTPPFGAELETTVTALAHYATLAEAGGIPSPTRAPDQSQARRQAAMQIPPLEPRLRGHLVHRVLSALCWLPQHPNTDDFVSAQLEIADFAPQAPATAALHQDLVAFLESPQARPILSAPPEHHRHELPFVLRSRHPKYKLTLRGQLDLIFWDNEGPVIVDYKHARDDASARETYLFQLDAYAWAVARMCNIQGPIRTRLVYLRDRSPPHEHLCDAARRQHVEATLHQWADNNA